MKKHIIIIGLAAVLIFGIILFSSYQTAKLNREFSGMVVSPTQPAPVALSRPALVASRPEDFGMVVTNSSTPVLTQEYWDDIISRKVKLIKENAPKDALEKINQAIKEDTVKTQENLAQVEANITKYRAALASDPSNREAKERLEHFLIYKSIARELPNKNE